MIERVTLLVQNSIAFDPQGNRDHGRDDWEIEDCGLMPADIAATFGKVRHPRAIQIIRLTPGQESALDDHCKLKLDPEAGCHPLK